MACISQRDGVVGCGSVAGGRGHGEEVELGGQLVEVDLRLLQGVLQLVPLRLQLVLRQTPHAVDTPHTVDTPHCADPTPMTYFVGWVVS